MVDIFYSADDIEIFVGLENKTLLLILVSLILVQWGANHSYATIQAKGN